MWATYSHLERAGPAKVDRDNPPEDQGDISGWKHISKLHTCQHCDKIVITHRQLKRRLVSLPHTKSEAIQAEADGCPVFRMLNGSWHLIARDDRPGDLLKLFRFLSDINDFRNCDSLIGTPAGFTKPSAENRAPSKKLAVLLRKAQFILDNLRRRHFCLFVSPQRLDFLYGTTAIQCDGQLKIIDGIKGEINAGGDLRPFHHSLTSKYDTEKDYANAKTFISLCKSTHGACQILPTVSFVPSRLLKVNPDSGPDYVRLVETRSDGQWTWACLSYVWGGQQRHKTTRSVLPQYLKDICLEVLPQTLKDAVSVCRELGIPYLWIDSFCIVQDDELDKTREIPQIAFIYRHALVTIAAGCARNVEEGFLHRVRPSYYRRFAPTSLRFRDKRGIESKPFVLAEKHGRTGFPEADEPIDSRAWALQEQLLSPRCLSYSSYGPVWTCRSLVQQVNRQAERVCRPRYVAEHPEFNGKHVLPCIPGLEMLPWENIVQLYSPRQATLHSDKLVALSTVAQTYSENVKHHDTYLAGIWRNSMPRSLLWYVPPEDRRPRPLEYTAPSWSWASVDGAVRYPDGRLKIDGDCELINTQIRTANSNMFGAVLGGKVIVDAKVRECRVQYVDSYGISSRYSCSGVSGGPRISFKADTMEFWTSLRNEDTDVTLMIVSHHGHDERSGLVLVRNTDSESFTRVSYFNVNNDWGGMSQREYDEFFEGFKIKRVTIV